MMKSKNKKKLEKIICIKNSGILQEKEDLN